MIVVRRGKDRLAPSDTSNDNHDQSQRIDMRARIHRDSFIKFWCRIATTSCDSCMCKLVDSDRDHKDDQQDDEHGERVSHERAGENEECKKIKLLYHDVKRASYHG